MKYYSASLTLVLETANPNICKCQWIERNKFLSLIFANYFNQDTPNDATIKHFFPEIIQEKMNSSAGN